MDLTCANDPASVYRAERKNCFLIVLFKKPGISDCKKLIKNKVVTKGRPRLIENTFLFSKT